MLGLVSMSGLGTSCELALKFILVSQHPITLFSNNSLGFASPIEHGRSLE